MYNSLCILFVVFFVSLAPLSRLMESLQNGSRIPLPLIVQDVVKSLPFGIERQFSHEVATDF
jgi:hypothetical protein